MLSCELKKLSQDWHDLLAPQLGDDFDDPIIRRIDDFLSRIHPHFFPPKENLLKPFHSVSVEDIRVVIVGNCPYPWDKQATGLPFSSPPGIKMGKSVEIIFRAIINNIGGKMPSSGCLEHLPPQGVFLINRKFTNADGGDEHCGVGWEEFSETVIYLLSKKLESSVFMLWGKPAKELSVCIDDTKHSVLLECHPANKYKWTTPPFVKCEHFSQANKILAENGRGEAIKWLKN